MRDGKEVTIDRYAVPQMHEQHVSEVQPGTFPCVFCLDLAAYACVIAAISMGYVTADVQNPRVAGPSEHTQGRLPSFVLSSVFAVVVFSTQQCEECCFFSSFSHESAMLNTCKCRRRLSMSCDTTFNGAASCGRAG